MIDSQRRTRAASASSFVKCDESTNPASTAAPPKRSRARMKPTSSASGLYPCPFFMTRGVPRSSLRAFASCSLTSSACFAAASTTAIAFASRDRYLMREAISMHSACNQLWVVLK